MPIKSHQPDADIVDKPFHDLILESVWVHSLMTPHREALASYWLIDLTDWFLIYRSIDLIGRLILLIDSIDQLIDRLIRLIVWFDWFDWSSEWLPDQWLFWLIDLSIDQFQIDAFDPSQYYTFDQVYLYSHSLSLSLHKIGVFNHWVEKFSIH